jgi:hypothetical protein
MGSDQLGYSSMLMMIIPAINHAECDEILHHIITELAPLIDVMHL